MMWGVVLYIVLNYDEMIFFKKKKQQIMYYIILDFLLQWNWFDAYIWL